MHNFTHILRSACLWINVNITKYFIITLLNNFELIHLLHNTKYKNHILNNGYTDCITTIYLANAIILLSLYTLTLNLYTLDYIQFT